MPLHSLVTTRSPVGPLRVEQLPALAESDPQLRRRGRYVTTTFLLEVGTEAYLIAIDRGQVLTVQPGPLVMPTWTFALRAEAGPWAAFWSAAPPPGSHDLFAMIKTGALRVEGNLHPFMSNLFYFKMLLAALRDRPE